MGKIEFDLIPYRYQEEVFQRAHRENIIAALNTGSGKTLISILLMKWIVLQEGSQGKSIIFLVPKVPLVEQQAEAIGRYTTLRVMKLHGAMEMDLSNRAGWKKKLESHDVFVMTAQIFLNLITHGLWTIGRVSLLIFDECHHARKNHPYNGILREYAQLPPSRRPKIFGMTASPIWNPHNPQASIQELEMNMHSKVVGVHENVAELEEKSPKPEERIERYPYPPDEYDCPVSTLFTCLTLINKTAWTDLGIPFYPSLETRYYNTLNNVGPYCASLFLFFEIRHLIENISRERDQDLFHSDEDTDPASKKFPDEVTFIRDILEDLRPFFPADPAKTIPISVPLDWCTPKVKVLVDLLLECHVKDPAFQCVVFVEQRQVASTLSKILQAIPELTGRITSAFLVGQGVNSEGLSRQSEHFNGDPVKMLKDGVINVLIATSVAEEGLDFKECDVVIRFDGLQHMVSYVQSRGRARKKASTFIVMVCDGQAEQLAKYLTLRDSEEHVTDIYRIRHLYDEDDTEEDDTTEEDYYLDLVDRERYVVHSTGAILTYDNSVQLLGMLCSQIPCDAFTAPFKPTYRGDVQSTLYLPRALPLPPADLVFRGPLKHSKKEAKRAVAFMAVKRLRELDVFDEYLLPLSREEDDDSATIPFGAVEKNRSNVPATMSVDVRDPWCIGRELWLHHLLIDGRVVAGLVTGTNLPPVEVITTTDQVRISCGELLQANGDQRRIMEDFTKVAIFCTITATPITSGLSLFLVPVTQEGHLDFGAMEYLLSNDKGCRDWSRVTENQTDPILMICHAQWGSIHLLHNIRHDLTPMSTPLPGSRESKCPTYHDYWTKKWSTKRREAKVSTDGPIAEAWKLSRTWLGSYSFSKDVEPIHTAYDGRLLPFADCGWIPISWDVQQAYSTLPAVCQRITHAYRALYARRELCLPPISEDLLIEALTIPSAALSFNNQRLETLGDAVLQVCTTVHLLYQYPNRHEGQLSKLRQRFVSNRFLLNRALDLGLDRYIISEIPSLRRWRYVIPDEVNDTNHPIRYVSREYPRRSLQDCMEATLGASFLTGGLPLALQTGTKLGLEFGGPLPWFMRYAQVGEPAPLPGHLAPVEEKLGYKFRYRHLLLEALTHPSAADPLEGFCCPSYQRLEFLGDAILNLVVVRYLYDKFPEATSHQLSHPRAKAICSPTLAYLSVTRLGLHKMMLADSFDLNLAISAYVPILENLTPDDIVKTGWKYDPPKALSDVFESVMGAVFIDSGHDHEKTTTVMEHVMHDVLEVLSPALGKDPISELTEWVARQGCRKLVFEKRRKENSEREGVAVVVHDCVVVGPIVSATTSRARFAAAERALAILQDVQSTKSIRRLCTCSLAMQVDTDSQDMPSTPHSEEESPHLDEGGIDI